MAPVSYICSPGNTSRWKSHLAFFVGTEILYIEILMCGMIFVGHVLVMCGVVFAGYVWGNICWLCFGGMWGDISWSSVGCFFLVMCGVIFVCW